MVILLFQCFFSRKHLIWLTIAFYFKKYMLMKTVATFTNGSKVILLIGLNMLFIIINNLRLIT